jgi:hypothetical protein
MPGSDGTERGCGDASAARLGGSSTGESGDESTTSPEDGSNVAGYMYSVGM